MAVTNDQRDPEGIGKALSSQPGASSIPGMLFTPGDDGGIEPFLFQYVPMIFGAFFWKRFWREQFESTNITHEFRTSSKPDKI